MASNNKNTNNSQSNDDEWISELIWALTKATGQLLWWAILFPTLSVPAILTIWDRHRPRSPRGAADRRPGYPRPTPAGRRGAHRLPRG